MAQKFKVGDKVRCVVPRIWSHGDATVTKVDDPREHAGLFKIWAKSDSTGTLGLFSENELELVVPDKVLIAPYTDYVGLTEHLGTCKVEAHLLPADSAERKKIPLGTGVLDYFTSALIEVAKVSYKGNEQHNPGQALHWSRGKSNDHADTLLRHFTERGTIDTDGMRHSAKLAWRALALLQQELEDAGAPVSRGSK